MHLSEFPFTVGINQRYTLGFSNMMVLTAEPAAMASFPALDDGLVALLGISSAGYFFLVWGA